MTLTMDISSELIHSLLPVFMGTILGASMSVIGLVEGVAEATAAIAKVFSGILSDWLGKRKLLAVLGYGLAAVTKPLFPLASSIDDHELVLDPEPRKRSSQIFSPVFASRHEAIPSRSIV